VRSEPPITVLPSESACTKDPERSAAALTLALIAVLLSPFEPPLEQADATTMSGIVAHAIQAPSR
jgi:hypothetical protein